MHYPYWKSKTWRGYSQCSADVIGWHYKREELISGEIVRLEAPYEPIQAVLKPSKNMDIGGGKGQEIETNIFGGTVGLIFDGRDRPITDTNKSRRKARIN